MSNPDRMIPVPDERLRRALRGAHIAVWELDLRQRRLSWSRNASEVLGCAPEDPRNFDERVHPDDQDRHQASLKATLSTGAPYDVEVRFVKPNGDIIWIKDTGELQADAHGRRMFSGICIDITARKQAEADARANEALLQVTLENMDQGLIMVDAEEIIQVFNRRVTELLGLPRELLQKRPTFGQVLEHQLASGEFVRAKGDLATLVSRPGFTMSPYLYERERANGTVLEVRTVALPDGGAVRTFTDITARRKTEAELRESEERYRALVLASATTVWRATPEGMITSVVTPSGPLSSDQLDHVRDHGWLATVHPEDRDLAYSHWRALFASGEQGENTFRLRRGNGEYRWSTVRAVPLRMSNGSVREWVGTFSDVHDQRHAQEQLAASEERLRLATEVTGLGTYSVDLRTGAREWSESMRALLGIAHDEPIGFEVFAARVHPEDSEWTHSRYAALQAEGIPFSAEFRIIRADNDEVRWVSGTSGMLLDDGGKPAKIVGSLQDITARKVTELALRESETRYRLLAETATDLILRTDLTGRCLYASHAAESILGFTPQELVGAEPKMVVHPGDIAHVWSGFQALVAGQIDQETATYRVRHKQGHWVWVEARRRLVQDSTSMPQEVVSIIRDISERQQLELQLRRSQRMEAIGQLTGGVAHDFNNMIQVILGNAEFLGATLSDPRLLTQVNMIQEAAERGASLTQHLLAFSRRQTLKPEHTDLCKVVKEMEPLLQRTIRKNIEFVTSYANEGSITSTDRALFETATLNLVLNARDAMPHGGTLAVRVGRGTADRAEGNLSVGQPVVFVEVTDTGTGMSPEVLERVFEPFFTTKDVGRGSGLGLPMVHGFAAQSGGYVTIRSTEGHGTSVKLVLPALPSVPRHKSDTEEELVPAGGSERILVVEDNLAVLQSVRRELTALGYEVEGATNGPEALDILRRASRFDLLFADVMLPKGITGVDLAKQARAIDPDLKVLLTSGYPEEVFERQGWPDEGIPVLRKPYRRKELAETLRRAMAGGRNQAGSGSLGPQTR